MVFLKNNPFIRLLLPFIVGICIEYYMPGTNKTLLAAIIGITAALLILTKNIKLYERRSVFGSLTSLFLISCGIYLTTTTNNSFRETSVNESILHGQITKPLEIKGKNYTTEIAIKAIKRNNIWHEHNTNSLVTFTNDTNLKALMAGDEIVFKAKVQNIESPLNPFDFDYKNYLAIKNIYAKLYIDKNNWHIIEHPSRGLRHIALNTRQDIINILDKSGITNENLAVLSALTMGYKNKLDEKIRTQYSGAGAMHVLAVSGLHVSIIYGLIELLLFWFKYFRKSKKLKAIVVLLGIWSYAFLTGLSPSVTRASVMFSFILGSQLLNKKSSIYNSIAASAFILLLVNPKLLFDVGFQLSYTAVIGIIVLQPKIKGILFFRFKLFNWAWQATAVSIAAQIATFPITVMHFHQFPTYFWLSNLFVTIAAFILICLTCLLILVSSIPLAAKYTAFVINHLLQANQWFIEGINKLPGHLISNINFSQLQVIFIYVAIFLLVTWLISKQYKNLVAALCTILIIGFIRFYEITESHYQSGMCTYHVYNGSALQFIENDQSTWLLSEPVQQKNILKTMQNANAYWRTINNNQFSIANISDTTITTEVLYFRRGYWKNRYTKGLLVHSNSYPPPIPKDSLKLDFILVCGNPTFSLNEIPDKITYKSIIIDGSVPRWKLGNFMPKDKNIQFFETKKSGAFVHVTKTWNK